MAIKNVVTLAVAALLGLGLQGAAAQANSFETPVSSDPSLLGALATATVPRGAISPPFTGRGTGSVEALLLEGVDFTAPDTAAIAAMKPLGGGSVQSVFNPNTRVRVYSTTFPARSTVLITNTVHGFRCSGFLIGPNTVVTAGHCVHSGGAAGSWYSTAGYAVYPGANGASFPFGGCAVRGTYSVEGWTLSMDERYDYGALKLDCTVGNSVGWYGFLWTPASLNYLPSIIPGYPGDRNMTQWWSSDTIRASYPEQIFYRNDTFEGMSGSPVWYDKPGVYAVGIHGYGVHGAPPHSDLNHGKRITSATYANLLNWKSRP